MPSNEMEQKHFKFFLFFFSFQAGINTDMETRQVWRYNMYDISLSVCGL